MLRIVGITLLAVAIAATSGCGSADSAGLVTQSPQPLAPASDASVPTITSISPTSAVAGGPDLKLTITGTELNPAPPHNGVTMAIWAANGSTTFLTTTVISSTQLTAVVPSALMRSPVNAKVSVQVGDPNRDTSFVTNSLDFSVIAPSATATPTPNLTPAPSNSLSGNWTGTFIADMDPGHSVDSSISGPLSESNDTLAPTGLVLGSSMCFAAVLVRSGTVNGSTVKMEMVAADFATIEFSGTLSGDRLSGTFTIDGSECGSGTGTLSMTRVPSVTGNWAGTLRSDATKLESSLTVSLTQTSTILTSTTNTAPFSISSLKIAGVIQQAGTGCILQVFSMAPGLIGAIQGPALNLTSNNDSTGTVLNGSVNLSSRSIAGTYKFVGTSCNGQTGTFTLNRM